MAGGGDFIGVMGWLPTPQLPGRHVHTVFVEPDGAELGRLLDLAARGVITPRTAGRVPLTEASTAIDHVRRGGHRGRWVVQPS
ncbi:MAG: hypothetical protein CMN30_22920 [Sandaracinus sp.]|nr:hypothetical protein [Sandaracinus sp.]